MYRTAVGWALEMPLCAMSCRRGSDQRLESGFRISAVGLHFGNLRQLLKLERATSEVSISWTASRGLIERLARMIVGSCTVVRRLLTFTEYR